MLGSLAEAQAQPFSLAAELLPANATDQFSEPAIRQGSQTYFGILATNEHGADLAGIFERNLRPAFVRPRDRPASLKRADKSSRAFL
jgi:hypothetical protein